MLTYVSNPLGNPRMGVTIVGTGNPAMTKGNQLAKKENLGPKAHSKRMSGLFKAWAAKKYKDSGAPYMNKKKRTMARRRSRAVLLVNAAKEAREVQQLLKCNMLKGIERLIKIIDSETAPEAAQIAAIGMMMDRAYGKAGQTNLNLNANIDGKAQEASGTELDQRIADALKQLESITGRAAEKTQGKRKPAKLRVSNNHSGSTGVH